MSINPTSREGSNAFSDALDREAELFLAKAAAAEGLTPHEFNVKYGIIGPAQERRIRRHEVSEAQKRFEDAMKMRKSTGDRNVLEGNRHEGRH